MPSKPAIIVGLLAATIVLGGCATSRSELRVSSPPTAQGAATAGSGPAVVIRTVKDSRIFEQAPSDPSVPSIGLEGTAQATAATKLRAVGRKRNSYGRALGDVVLQDGQTVETLVRDNVAASLRDAGYRVQTGTTPDPSALVVDVDIRKFWSWVQPGFWAITVKSDVVTDLKLSTKPQPMVVTVHVEEPRAAVTDAAWMESIDKVLQAFRAEVTRQLPAVK